MKRRNQIALTPAEREAFLHSGKTIVLCSTDHHGYPHPVAMWYAIEDDGTIVMTTYAKSQKAMNLRRDPRCSLLLETGPTYEELKGLLIRGRAVLDPDTEHVLDVLEKVHARGYFGALPPGGTSTLREAMRAQASKRVALRIRPERVSSWDHRKLAGAY